MKKVLSLIMMFLMVLGMLSFVACGDQTPPNVDDPDDDQADDRPDNNQEDEEIKLEPDLPDVTYGGEEFVFYQWDEFYQADLAEPHCWNDIWVEDYTGDTIDNAVFTRNGFIEEKYQIDIVLDVDQYVTFFNNVRTSVSTGDDLYDVVVAMGHHNPGIGTSDVFYNMCDINYIDLTKPWWSQTAIADCSLAGYLPFAVSDLTILDKGATAATFFNKKMVGDFELGNLYELVSEGYWTLEELIDMGEIVASETGDDIWNDQDVYGLVSADYPVEMLFHGFGMRYAETDKDGYPVISFTDEGNFAKIQVYLDDLMFNESLTYNREWYTGETSFLNMFMEEKGLFMIHKLNAVKTLANMETDYGILPIPKWDENQEQYYSSVSVFGCNLLSIPISNTEPDVAGVILEAMSAESRYTLIPAFYDVVLKGRASRDAESKEMLDIIFETMVFDIGVFYNLAGFPDDFLRLTGNANANGHAKPARSSNIASFWAEREDLVEADLEELIETINEWTTTN